MNSLGAQRRWGRALLLVGLVIASCCIVAPVQAQAPVVPGFAFIPFENNADFTGKWKVGVDVPRFLCAYVKELYRIPTVSPVVVQDFFLEEQRKLGVAIDDVKFWDQLFRRFGVRYLITGTVETFDVSRFTTGPPQIGGYEAFKGEVGITYTIYDLDRTESSAMAVPIKKGEVSGEYADRSLTLTFLGKPSERTVEFRELDKIRFGSDEFNRTVIGQACYQLGERFARQIESTMPSIKAWKMTNPDSLLRLGQSMDTISMSFKPVEISGVVVFVERVSAFINLGSEDGIQVAQTIPVYGNPMEQNAAAGPIGELTVLEVRGPHLSLTRILSGEKSIRVRDKVSVTVLR
jgi:hypothetical protein